MENEDLVFAESQSIKFRLQRLAGVWKYRQGCNNHPELSITSKAKAHVYGICAEELLKALKEKK